LTAGLTVWAVLVPEATLAAVVIAAAIELVDVPALIRLYRVSTAGVWDVPMGSQRARISSRQLPRFSA
jgi:hypothetical protein